jgi:hypothetical protein
MKYIVIFFIFSTLNLASQTNLVSNPSFEQTSSNNNFLTWMNFTDWIKPPNDGNTPDPFKNNSSGNCLGGCLPGQHTFAGNTYAYSGENFIGVLGYYIQGGQQNGREYIHQELADELKAGHVYRMGFALKFGSRTKHIIDRFGMFISDTAIGPSNTAPLQDIIPVIPQLELNIPFGDSLDWTVLSIDYTAFGGEKFITLGNFTPDSLLNVSVNPMYNPSDTVHSFALYGSYFFIDSVFIHDHDTTTSTASMVELKSKLDFKLFPNPANDFVEFSIKEGSLIQEITLIDILGRKLKEFPTDDRKFDLSGVSRGEYFLQLQTESGKITEKLIIN